MNHFRNFTNWAKQISWNDVSQVNNIQQVHQYKQPKEMISLKTFYFPFFFSFFLSFFHSFIQNSKRMKTFSICSPVFLLCFLSLFSLVSANAPNPQRPPLILMGNPPAKAKAIPKEFFNMIFSKLPVTIRCSYGMCSSKLNRISFYRMVRHLRHANGEQ